MSEANTKVNFNDIVWAALCFYFRMSDSKAAKPLLLLLRDQHGWGGPYR